MKSLGFTLGWMMMAALSGLIAGNTRAADPRIDLSVERASRTEAMAGMIALAGVPANPGAAAGEVTVAAGPGSIVDETRRPTAPAQLLGAPVLPQPRVIQFAPVLQLRFPALPGAVSYRVRLAADEGIDRVIRETVLPQPLVNFADLAAGGYVLTVSAIDRLGLEGRESSVPVRLIAGNPPAAAPAAEPSGAAPVSPAALPPPSSPPPASEGQR